MTKIQSIIDHLESIAPPQFAESYDNPGLLTGNPGDSVTGVLTCLDCTEEVVDDAIENGENLIVAHHPIIFGGLKSITGKNYVERTILKAIKNDIAIYAIHTNLDSVLQNGVSTEIGRQLGLEGMQILQPKQEEAELEVIVMQMRKTDTYQIAEELTGKTFYKEFAIETPDGPRFQLFWKGRRDQAQKLARLLSDQLIETRMLSGSNLSKEIGLGVIGHLAVPLPENVFLDQIKSRLPVKMIRHSSLLGRSIQKVAICGGSGSFLLKTAIARGADIFVTGDFKYHEFFDADKKIIIADIGHYESEHSTIGLLRELIQEKFSTFAVRCTNVDTNPINYR